jgi:hypothetical protein
MKLENIQLNSFVPRKQYPQSIGFEVLALKRDLQIKYENTDLTFEEIAVIIDKEIQKKYGHLLAVR